MSDLPAVPRSALEAAGAVVTETSLVLSDPELDWDDYENLGRFVGRLNRSCAWWVGDLIIHGEQLFGHAYAQIEDALGLAPQTLANRASVARHIPPNRRRAALPFGVHAEVAYLEPRERDLWLDKAERGEWTRAKLREEMRAARGISSSQADDLVVTSKSDGSPHADHREEHSVSGVPAADARHRGLLGELVPGSKSLYCPHCGIEISETVIIEN